MVEVIPASKGALEEALALSAEILKNVELSELPLSSIALKASRLARLLNDFDAQHMFAYEAGGYPSTPDGLQPEVWKLAELAGRAYAHSDRENGTRHYAYVDAIAALENTLGLSEAALAAARDPDVSISCANPAQRVRRPPGNLPERQNIWKDASQAAARLAARLSLLYDYAAQRHYELRFSRIADDIFSRVRETVDASIGPVIPTAIQSLGAIYESLASEDPDDWSKAVHGCQRMLQDLADAVFPARQDRFGRVGAVDRALGMRHDDYIARLLAFVEMHADRESSREVMASHLRFIGERLHGIVTEQTDSHAVRTSRQEADRCVISTYLLVGDILSLAPKAALSTPRVAAE